MPSFKFIGLLVLEKKIFKKFLPYMDKLSSHTLEIAEKYVYLGLLLMEHLDFEKNVQ